MRRLFFSYANGVTGLSGVALMRTSRPAPLERTGTERERILAAAVDMLAQASPVPPTVNDIIVAAGTCNKTFYHYFGSKDDLWLAAMQRGVSIVTAKLARQMDATTDPAEQVARWVAGLLDQLTDPRHFTMCRATVAQLSAIAQREVADDDIMVPLRALLRPPIARLGRAHPERDAEAVFHTTMGTLRTYLGSGRRPPPDEIEHLVGFCLSGIGA